MRQLQVVKIGTSSVFHDETIDYMVLSNLGYDLAKLRYERETDSVLVVSGAIKLGKRKLGFKTEPISDLENLASASMGQDELKEHYTVGLKQGFERYAQEKGLVGLGFYLNQRLFTNYQLSETKTRRYAVHLLDYLIAKGIVPLVNYDNALDDIPDQSNDILAAQIAKALIADRFVILTDVDGLLDRDDNLILRISYINESIKALCRDEGNGIGGMLTKLEAADLLLKECIPTIIGNTKYGLLELIENERIRTLVKNIQNH